MVFFSQILNSILDVYLKLNDRGKDDKILRFEQNEDLKWNSITTLKNS